MSNSSLISYTKLSPNHSGKRKNKIDTISIHCMAGNLSVESCGNVFASSSRKASSNYGIGSDGRIALYVDEANRSWCTSSSSNDNRAVTIEVANTSSKDPWPCSDAAYNALIDLVTDICQRNGIKKLVWSTNKNDRVNHLNGCNMTVHRDYAAKACPGDWLYNRHGQIAEEVNARLGNGSTSSTTVSYQVKVVSNDGTLNCRSSASASSSIVKTYTNGTILTITKESGNWGYTGEGWISLKYTEKYTAPAAPTHVKEEEEVTQEQFNEMMNTYLETLAAKDPTWEKDYMERAQAEGLVVGDEQGRLMPKKLMTRGEMLTVILRLEDKLKNA